MIHFYWEKMEWKPGKNQRWFDFRELEHVYNVFQMWEELDETEEENEVKNIEDWNTSSFMRALKFYVKMADLSEVQREILDLKLDKKKNQDIADIVNKKYKKSYTANYISTIFR